jgi:hypothetical protein
MGRPDGEDQGKREQADHQDSDHALAGNGVESPVRCAVDDVRRRCVHLCADSATPIRRR